MENIDQSGIWKPGIFETYSAIAYGGSTRKFNSLLCILRDKPALKIFREVDRLSRGIGEKLIAARFLIKLLGLMSPGKSNAHLVVKNKLIHGSRIVLIDDKFVARSPELRVKRTLDSDGLITNVPGVTLMMTGADCTPVAIFDPVNYAIGILHSGWRGTAAEIVVRGLERMKEAFGSEPKNILVSIGPSIAKKDFEVGENVYVEYAKTFPAYLMNAIFTPTVNKKFLLDQPTAIEMQLIGAGVPIKNIEISRFSTGGEGENYLFSSARKEKGIDNTDSSFYLLCLKKTGR